MDRHVETFNRDIRELLRTAWRVTAKRPAQAAFFLRVIGWQQKAARLRRRWAEKGAQVPPLLIVSITNRCNLACKGCYARELRPGGEQEMDPETFRRVLGEAKELGSWIVLLAGGEPLVRLELLDVAASFREMLFPVFTNGLLIDAAFLSRCGRQPSLVPVLSLEGYREDTDTRRGAGVFVHLNQTASRLAAAGIFHGVSLTATRANLTTILDDRFVEGLIATGTRLFFFVEYVPVKAGTEDWILTDEQKRLFLARLDQFRARFPGLFIAFPGDEEEYGGCLSAGRGFLHISAGGRVEPCPFAPYSDTGVAEHSLRVALDSPLLAQIRANHAELRETRGGCALWQKRGWVRALAGASLPDRRRSV
jgi:MoaA/NifB/PqqE/SkfB family radical SAM enzyme